MDGWSVFEKLISDPTGRSLIAVMFGGSVLLAFVVVVFGFRYLSGRSKAQEATTGSLSELLTKLTDSNTTLVNSQITLNAKQAELAEKQLKTEEDQKNAMQQLVEQTKAIRQISVAQRYEIVQLGEQMSKQGTEFIDALSPIAEDVARAGDNTDTLLRLISEIDTRTQTILGAAQSLCDVTRTLNRNDEHVVERLDILATGVETLTTRLSESQQLLADIKLTLETPVPAPEVLPAPAGVESATE